MMDAKAHALYLAIETGCPEESRPGLLYRGHLLYESLKVDLTRRQEAARLGRALLHWATRLGWAQWIEFYQSEGYLATSTANPCEHTALAPSPLGQPGEPPQLLQWLSSVLDKAIQNSPSTPRTLKSTSVIAKLPDFPDWDTIPLAGSSPDKLILQKLVASTGRTLSTALVESHGLVRIYRCLADRPTPAWAKAVQVCIELGWSRTYLRCLSPAVTLPIYEAFRRVQAAPPVGLRDPDALALIRRPDLAALWASPAPSSTPPTPSFPLSGVPISAAGSLTTGSSLGYNYTSRPSISSGLPNIESIHQQLQQADGSHPHTGEKGTGLLPPTYTWLTEPGQGKVLNLTHHEMVALRFPHDQRIREVARLLRSHLPIKLPGPAPATDPNDSVDPEQRLLRALVTRTLALPVGRAMFQYAATLPVLTEKFPIPGLALSARFGTSKAVVELTVTPTETEDLLSWPSFHDGVAAALSISPDAAALDSSWVLLNQADTDEDYKPRARLSPRTVMALSAHAGWIFGLGLTGHLRHLISWNAFHYLTTKHPPTAVGLLLGLAAAHRGTGDPTVARLLAIHVPAFLPANATNLLLAPLTKTAGLFGLALLHAQSAHRRTVEVLLQELVRHSTDSGDPETAGQDEEEAYTLTVGLSLGLVVLAQGHQAPGLSDLHLVDTLVERLDMNPAPGGRMRGARQSAVTRPVELDGFTMVDSRGSLFTIPGSIHSTSLLSRVPSLDGGPHSSGQAYPGGPSAGSSTPSLAQASAATLALALMFMKTEDPWMADKLNLPPTPYLLRQLHPHLVLLRTLARGLVLWNQVQPTAQWLFHTCPGTGLANVIPVTDLDPRASATLPVLQPLLHRLDDVTRRAFFCAVTGSALALGLKYAGTGSASATQLLLGWYDQLLAWTKRAIMGFEAHLVKHVARQCLYVTINAAALVQAGSGSLDLLRRLRVLHGRLGTTDLHYGDHLLPHMALGMTFLGAGNYTLSSTDNLATAALLCSFYPDLTMEPNDNRRYLQALRHMWVLAVDARCVTVRDVETGEIQPLAIKVTTTGSGQTEADPARPLELDDIRQMESVVLDTPGFVPPWSSIQTIEINDTGYWPLLLELNGVPELRLALQKKRTLWVEINCNLVRFRQFRLPDQLSLAEPQEQFLKEALEASLVANEPDVLAVYTFIYRTLNLWGMAQSSQHPPDSTVNSPGRKPSAVPTAFETRLALQDCQFIVNFYINQWPRICP
ncbi:Anaphase-promoting complex subunit 1 [Dimargaris cristalligena]|nr:Anaphase-promoting complex subunit 1 [Dimargaris cristalligena]